MSTRVFAVCAILISLLQGSLLPPVLFEGLLLVVFIFSKGVSRTLVALFIFGIFIDLIQYQTLGVSSLLFMVYALLINAVREQIPLQNPIVLSLVALVLLLARSQIIFGSIFLVPIIVGSLIAFLIFTFLWRPTTDSLRLRI